ncbi:MAG: tyrosine-type recombinase/integrase [Eubacteriales bacterium]|nr:tyrosine-type recombinase/integrase [Eubacteriales bacterium]
MLDLQGFETYLMREERSENTIGCYRRDVQAFLAWHGDADLQRLSELDLIRYKKYLNAKERTVITANRKLASVNAFCRYLYDARALPEAYAAKLTKNRDRPQYKGLPVDDLRRLREHIHEVGDPMHICIIELLLGTGLRVSELAGLTLTDLTLGGCPHIRVLGKGSVNRTLPLNAAALAAVEAYLKVRGEAATARLLLGQRGPLGRGAIEIILAKYGETLGIRVTPHMLRHSLAYQLIKGGTPMTTIQQILGHESILTTNLYTQTTAQDKADALTQLAW